MESVFFLDKNYRVKSEEFLKLLARLHVGWSTTKDVNHVTDLHLAYYKHDKTFITNLKHNPKTMLLYAKNMDQDKTNMDILIQTSKMNNVLVAKISYQYETNRAPISYCQQLTIWESHFDKEWTIKNWYMCRS
jgi:hypothetical protein